MRAFSSLCKASWYVSWGLPVREQHHTNELHKITRWQNSLQNTLVSIIANLQLHCTSKINCIGLHQASHPPIKQAQQLQNFLQKSTSKWNYIFHSPDAQLQHSHKTCNTLYHTEHNWHPQLFVPSKVWSHCTRPEFLKMVNIKTKFAKIWS